MVEAVKNTALKRPHFVVNVAIYMLEESSIQRHVYHLCGGVGLTIVMGTDSSNRLNFPDERIRVV